MSSALTTKAPDRVDSPVRAHRGSPAWDVAHAGSLVARRSSTVIRLLGILVCCHALTAVAAGAATTKDEPMLLTDFDVDSDLGWFSVNDSVMGGRSAGGFRIEAGVLVFSGTTNTKGGGFSSIRTQTRLPSLEGRRAILLRARGDGRRYILRLEGAGGVAYWADFQPSADAPGWLRVPFEDFRPRFRGRWLPGPPLDVTSIVALGIMCYDGQNGPFRLEVERIEAE